MISKYLLFDIFYWATWESLIELNWRMKESLTLSDQANCYSDVRAASCHSSSFLDLEVPKHSEINFQLGKSRKRIIATSINYLLLINSSLICFNQHTQYICKYPLLLPTFLLQFLITILSWFKYLQTTVEVISKRSRIEIVAQCWTLCLNIPTMEKFCQYLQSLLKR